MAVYSEAYNLVEHSPCETLPTVRLARFVAGPSAIPPVALPAKKCRRQRRWLGVLGLSALMTVAGNFRPALLLCSGGLRVDDSQWTQQAIDIDPDLIEVTDDDQSLSASFIMDKTCGAAVRGATAALMAALLFTFTEPAMNRLLVQRCSMKVAIKSMWTCSSFSFFLTVLTANALKMPFDELIGLALSFVPLTAYLRGLLHGWLHTLFLLPVSNIRFRKSMDLPFDPRLLYQAYLPTVLRDMVFGCARHVVGGWWGVACADLGSGSELPVQTQALRYGLTVFVSCIAAAPLNEWRGYRLQPSDEVLPFWQFFKLGPCLRSTLVGGFILSCSMALGTLAPNLLF